MRQGVRPVGSAFIDHGYAAGQAGRCGLTGLLGRHRRDLLLGALLILIPTAICGGLFIGVYFVADAMNNMARAQGALVQLAGALVAIVVTSIGILIGIGVVFVAYCWLQEIGEEIADDWRTRPRRPARG